MASTTQSGQRSRSSRLTCPDHRLSALLTAGCASAFVSGLLTGLAWYLDRSPVRRHHSPGTAAWGQHALLGALAVVLAVIGYRQWRVARARAARDGDPAPLGLLAPLGARAGRRLAYTLSAARQGRIARATIAVALVASFGYAVFRAGIQLLSGLDPNATVNAWGGPSYLGALVCHYLDVGLIMTVSAAALNRLLLPDPHSRTGRF
jgi:hypothetical protein